MSGVFVAGVGCSELLVLSEQSLDGTDMKNTILVMLLLIVHFANVSFRSRTASSADYNARRILHLHALCASAVILYTFLIAEPGTSAVSWFIDSGDRLCYFLFCDQIHSHSVTKSIICLYTIYIIRSYKDSPSVGRL
ncbi:hypothetical protein BDR07DRAFT_1446954 [Suillus spraguei]|nr:hypothetical protein BDR07DRAFT_1446954 [Suillus spraguei]